jgi:hypothetical protein
MLYSFYELKCESISISLDGNNASRIWEQITHSAEEREIKNVW